MAHDVFLSYSQRDKSTADAVCHALEAEGIRAWMAPRDIVPGMEWPEAIATAISGSRVMVVIFSLASNVSKHVRREVERAVNDEVTIIPFRIDEVKPSGSMEYLLAMTHWLDAYTPPLQQHVRRLVATLKQILDKPSPPIVVVGEEGELHVEPRHPPADPPVQPVIVPPDAAEASPAKPSPEKGKNGASGVRRKGQFSEKAVGQILFFGALFYGAIFLVVMLMKQCAGK